MQHRLKDWFHRLKTSRNHWLRKGIGVALVVGGLLGFLPILGYWMLPLGIALLAVDFPVARRLHRRMSVWWGRQRQRLSGRSSIAAARRARASGRTGA